MSGKRPPSLPRQAYKLLKYLLLGMTLLILLGAGMFATLMLTSPSPYTPLSGQDPSRLALIGIGDQGTGKLMQWQVAQAMDRVAARDGRLDMVILLGDNFYGKPLTGVHDWNWQLKFERVYFGQYLSHIPFFAVLGNHDYPSSSEVELKYSRKYIGSMRWQMPAATYTRDFGNVEGRPLLRVVFLDTAVPAAELKAQVDIIDQAFTQPGPAPVWRLVAAHHPIRSAGQDPEDSQLINLLLPALQRNKVDLYLAGHNHNQQLLLRPGEPAWLISGGGGHSLSTLLSDRSQTTFAAYRSGFVKVDLSAAQADVAYYDANGGEAHHFIWDRACPWMAQGCLKAAIAQPVPQSVTQRDSQ